MRWYDRQPSHLLGRIAHRIWFRSWNQIEDIGGGGWWLPITRRLGWNTKGEYENWYWAFFFLAPFALWIIFTVMNYLWNLFAAI